MSARIVSFGQNRGFAADRKSAMSFALAYHLAFASLKYTPGGFELFFKDFGERLRRGPIGLDELNRLGEPHGIRFFDDWIPDLKAAYDLRVIGE
jgi:hypothetical protein